MAALTVLLIMLSILAPTFVACGVVEKIEAMRQHKAQAVNGTERMEINHQTSGYGRKWR